MATATITVPFDGRPKRFERDQLTTAILLRMEHGPNGPAVVNALVSEHGIPKRDAIFLAVAARICLENGIEP